MSNARLYTMDEVYQALMLTVMLLENGIFDADQGENDMAKRLKQLVTVHGKERWVTGANIGDKIGRASCRERV